MEEHRTDTAATTRLALAAAAVTGVQVGATIVATRAVADEIGPFSLAFLRYAIGVACLLPAVVVVGGLPRMSYRDLLPVALLGVVQFGGVIALLNHGLTRIPAGRGALIFAAFPLFTLLLAAALGRERLTLPKASGVLLALAGVALVIGPVGQDHGTADHIGDISILAAALCGGACSVLSAPYLRRYPALPLGVLAMLVSVAFLAVPASIGEEPLRAVSHLGGAAWGAVLFIGVGTGVGHFLWFWALGRATPTQVTVFLSLSPVTAVLLGATLLGEPVPPMTLPALVCLATGFWLTGR